MKRSIRFVCSSGPITSGFKAAIVAAAVSLTGSSAEAGGCHCQQPAEFPGPSYCQCESGWGHQRREPGPIYKTLDAFAGGIEKLLQLDGSSGSAACDDACDAAMVRELSQPAFPPAPLPPQPGAAPQRHRRVIPHGELPAPASPQHAEPMRMSSPKFQPLSPESGSGAQEAAPRDGASDPFLDDSVSVDPRGGAFVRPSSYETRAVPRVSSRRLNSAR